jgi:hypothetical protein
MDNYDLNDLIEAEIDRLDNYEWLFEADDEVANDETI